jgi:hypothetical protein
VKKVNAKPRLKAVEGSARQRGTATKGGSSSRSRAPGAAVRAARSGGPFWRLCRAGSSSTAAGRGRRRGTRRCPPPPPSCCPGRRRPRGVRSPTRRRAARAACRRRLGVDVEGVITPPCVFCIGNN